jgi:hypothetical protein
MGIKANLCKCINCDTVLIDTNPQTGAPLLNIPDAAKELTLIQDGKDYIHACPICLTDAYLIDINEEQV